MANSDQTTTTELTPKQELLIALLLAGLNIAAAAKQAGIGDKTARRWLKLPHFLAAYKLAQQSLFDESLNELRTGVQDAIKALRRHVNADVEVTPATQIRAAIAWIEQAVELHKTAEIEAKITELEQALKLQGRDR